MENNNINYDELATQCGVPVNENDNVKTLSESEKDDALSKAVKKANSYAYDDGCPIPGQNIDVNRQSTDLGKDKAIENLVALNAINKARQESALAYKMSKEERARQKKEFVDMMMYQQEEAYFVQNHYVMDGKTKRRYRKMIERKYDKGQLRPSGVNLND